MQSGGRGSAVQGVSDGKRVMEGGEEGGMRGLTTGAGGASVGPVGSFGRGS